MSPPRKTVREEPKAGAPTYIVTYSDMITLLLTFFVMLLSLARQQVEEHRFKAGQESLRKSLADFGLTGSLFNRGSGVEFEHPKVLYKVPEDKQPVTQEELNTRSIDEHGDMLRRIVRDIEQMMHTSPSQITGTHLTPVSTTIRFDDEAWTMDDEARGFLTNFSLQLQASVGHRHAIIYVVGLAADEPTAAEQWAVSARRAQAVADFLRGTLPEDNTWSIYSWGAGPGGDWAGPTGMASRDSHILLATLTDE